MSWGWNLSIGCLWVIKQVANMWFCPIKGIGSLTGTAQVIVPWITTLIPPMKTHHLFKSWALKSTPDPWELLLILMSNMREPSMTLLYWHPLLLIHQTVSKECHNPWQSLTLYILEMTWYLDVTIQHWERSCLSLEEWQLKMNFALLFWPIIVQIDSIVQWTLWLLVWVDQQMKILLKLYNLAWIIMRQITMKRSQNLFQIKGNIHHTYSPITSLYMTQKFKAFLVYIFW